MKRGVFVSVDGPNGAGKSSFIEALSKKVALSFPVFVTKEPSSTQFGDFVKRNEQHLTGLPYAHLIWSDRYFHVENFVLPQLNSGKVVISDRYVESSFVLQGFDGVPAEKIWDLNKNFIIPSVSIILLAKPNVLEERLSQRMFLSNFEKKMSREQEVDMYKKAIDFLSKKGFQHVIYENNTPDDLKKNIDEAYSKIYTLMR